MKDLYIRLLLANFPEIDAALFDTPAADQITGHLIKEYPDLTINMFEKNAFYFHLYGYLVLKKDHSFNEVYTKIAQDYQTFEIDSLAMN